jgi:hypothetical protein
MLLRKEPAMSPTRSSEEAPVASLIGYLSAFTLSDVLFLLASTKQTGELRVVNELVDGQLWLADGELSNGQVGAAATIGQAVFELACVVEGWFYFTVGVTSSSGQPTVPVAAVLNEVRPQVAEWLEIRKVVPLEAVVTLSPDPPGRDIQIRSDQWRVLTAVGSSGRSVKAVLEQIGGDQIVGMRTLRDLLTAGLIVLGSVAGEDPPPESALTDSTGPDVNAPSVPPRSEPDQTPGGAAHDLGTPPPAADSLDGGSGGPANTTLLPPPPLRDPWALVADGNDGSNGVA